MTSDRGLACPNCASGKLDILETRRKGSVMKRRRQCGVCEFRFNTVEISEADYDRAVRGLDGKTVRALALLKDAADALRGLPDEAI